MSRRIIWTGRRMPDKASLRRLAAREGVPVNRLRAEPAGPWEGVRYGWRVITLGEVSGE